MAAPVKRSSAVLATIAIVTVPDGPVTSVKSVHWTVVLENANQMAMGREIIVTVTERALTAITARTTGAPLTADRENVTTMAISPVSTAIVTELVLPVTRAERKCAHSTVELEYVPLLQAGRAVTASVLEPVLLENIAIVHSNVGPEFANIPQVEPDNTAIVLIPVSKAKLVKHHCATWSVPMADSASLPKA